MAKKSAKPRDTNSMAAAIVAQSIDDEDQGDDPYEGKNPAAVELGRLGGRKGGKARTDKLDPERRSEIARKAAQARWGDAPNSDTTVASPE
jgi:general stress protein YciG